VVQIADSCLALSSGHLERTGRGLAPTGCDDPFLRSAAAPLPSAEQPPVNPVHSQLDMLEARLSAAGQVGEPTVHPAQACLDPLLMALGWHGVERHLFEALPHFDPIATIDDLRAVLVRLNYRTEPCRARICDIAADAFPCLFESGGKIYVLLGSEEDGVLTAFDGETQQFVDIDNLAMAGTAYLLTPIDVRADREALQKGNWLAAVALRFKRLLLMMLGLGAITNLFALALPLYVMTVYDKAIGARATEVLAALTIGIAVIVVMDMVLRAIRARAQAYFGARLDNLVGNHAFSQLLYMPVTMTESASIGGQFTRLRQFESVRETFTGPLANALIDIPYTVVFIAAIAAIGGHLAWVPVVLMAVYALVGMFVVPRIRAHVLAAGEVKSKLQNLVMEMLARQRTIRNVSAEQVWIDRFRGLSAEFNRKNLETRALNFNTQTLSQTMMLVAGTAMLGFGTLHALDGALSAGALIGVMALTWRVLNPLNQAFVSLTRLGQTLQSVEQVNKLMRLPVERIPNELPSAYRSFKGAVTVSRLIFRYASRQEPVLRGMNFSIKPGEVVVLTGASGAGKSTTLKMILGLYVPQGGAVLADGLDVRQLNAGEWRHAISYAPEHLQLFYGSVAQNLKLANPTATDVDVTRAAEEAGVLDPEFALYLPEGVETRLTGQRLHAMPDELKQRILLARAFVKPAPIYLLDSPANNLGTAGQKLLMGKIARLRGRSTVIIVSHRREMMEMADRVIVLERGQVAIDGPAQKVMDRLGKAA
jgi:ABC-type bacteriocin/lantibiotic exporter with double-glycine peptidase domain